jgi:hypothetical protein
LISRRTKHYSTCSRTMPNGAPSPMARPITLRISSTKRNFDASD